MKEFLSKNNIIAVVGASRNKEKYGYLIFKALVNAGFFVYPVNPKAEDIDGIKCYPNLNSLPKKPDLVITVVPPKITEKIVQDMKKFGINKIWMQPGSESKEAIGLCKKYGIKWVANTCFVVDGLKKELKKLAFQL